MTCSMLAVAAVAGGGGGEERWGLAPPLWALGGGSGGRPSEGATRPGSTSRCDGYWCSLGANNSTPDGGVVVGGLMMSPEVLAVAMLSTDAEGGQVDFLGGESLRIHNDKHSYSSW